MKISDYVELPKDGNTFLFNTLYNKKDWRDKDSKDTLSLIYKNIKSGKKRLIEIDEPSFTMFKLNDGIVLPNTWQAVMELDKVHEIDLKYNSLIQEMYKEIGEEKTYWNLLKARNSKELNTIYFDNRLYGADLNIEDFYRMKSHEYFGDIQIKNITKGYFDIECDGRLGNINLKEGNGDAPINAITYIAGNDKICYTMLLRNDKNPLIEDFEKNRLNEFTQTLHDMFDKKYGVLTYKLAFFDSEVDLIKTLFDIINTTQVDYAMIWNGASFDMPYIEDRLLKNGVDPASVICHKDFAKKQCLRVRDTHNFEIKKKTDHYIVSSYTIYIDQMIQYASIRKSQSNIDSYKIDDIGEDELNEHKIEYEGDIKDFPYKNYFDFVLYNIKDVLLMYGIEEKVKDIDTVQLRSYANDTRMHKIFKETVLLYNVSYKAFMDYGFVFGNNINSILYNEEQKRLREAGLLKKGKAKPKYKGALVSNPLLLQAIGIKNALGELSRRIIDLIIDYDYTSLYPTIIRMFNIFITTLVGKITINCKPTSDQLKYAFDIDTFDLGCAFAEDYTTDEMIYMMTKYFGMPSANDILNELDIMFKQHKKIVAKKCEPIKIVGRMIDYDN